jgi:MSHA biogenesis protein MshK
VSLILEALKKVERERATPEQRGFLVLGPAAWSPSRPYVGMVLGMIGAALLAGGVVYLFTRPDAPPSAAVPRAAAPAVAPLPPPREMPPATVAWEPPPVSAARPRPSATTPPTTPAAPSRVLVLNAISEQDGVPIAVIDDRVVREGDRFDGVRVVRIRATEVEVEVDGARRVLRF